MKGTRWNCHDWRKMMGRGGKKIGELRTPVQFTFPGGSRNQKLRIQKGSCTDGKGRRERNLRGREGTTRESGVRVGKGRNPIA